MTLRCIGLLIFFSFFSSIGKAETWIRVFSGELEVLTTASPKEAEDVWRRADSCIAGLRRVWPVRARRLSVFVVSGVHDVLPSRQPGHYQFDGAHDTIVVSRGATDFNRILCHEVTHFWMQQVFGSLPSWLNEGIAEYFSTMRETPESFEYGVPIAAHVALLEAGKQEDYSSNWAQVHSLMTASENWKDVSTFERPKAVVSRNFPVRQIAGSKRTLPALEREWVPEPRLIWDLLLSLNPAARTVDRNTKDRDLAMGAWERGDGALYRKLLEKAVEKNPNDSQMLFALGTLLTRLQEGISAVLVLRRACALDANRFSCWEALAIAAALISNGSLAAEASERASRLASDDADLRRVNALRAQLAPEFTMMERKPAVINQRTPPAVVDGYLMQVDCLAEHARIVVKQDHATLRLLLGSHSVNADGMEELACGEIKPLQVRIEYRAREDASYRTAGDVVRIERR